LDSFIVTWPEVDAETSLSLRGDELLIKAREALIAAVHTFNSAGLTFLTELFMVTAIIAWTYCANYGTTSGTARPARLAKWSAPINGSSVFVTNGD